jgi:predicted anti-sigma-YlaC factor YlaD
MRCDHWHEVLSARLDGEASDVEVARLDVHLARCAACRAYAAELDGLHRRARVRSAEPVPDLSGSILATIGGRDEGRAQRRAVGVRVAVALVGALHLLLSVPAIALGQDGSAPIHVAHELGVFGAALGVGLLIAAWRPACAAGMLAIAGPLVIGLLATAAIDVAAGRRPLHLELQHLVDIVTVGSLWLLSRRSGWTLRSVTRLPVAL